MKADEINRLDSESGIIATLIKHPDFSFYSENLMLGLFGRKDLKAIRLLNGLIST